MNKYNILLSLVAALFLIAGLAPAQATFTSVKGAETIIAMPNLGEVTCHGGIPTGNPFAPCPPGVSGTIRGRQGVALEATTDDRLNGINYTTSNGNVHPNGTINIWGTFRIEVTTGGVWEGVWEGKQESDGTVTYSATGHGSGGAVEGLQVLWNGVYSPGSPIAEITARILAPGKLNK